MAASPSQIIPATILTGFLGSGKTTLLNRILHANHGLRLAVIVNEFGQVGIDGQAVAGGEQFVELDNGCLCCAINEDLQQTLLELKDRGGFEQIVVETTGLADPLPVAWTFTRPGLSDVYRVDAIVGVVDAVNVANLVETHPEARAQIERADILVLNKMDVVADAGRSATAVLQRLNPDAPRLEGSYGDVPVGVLLSPDTPSGAATLTGPPAHSDAKQHAPGLETWAFVTQGRLSDAGLEDLLFELPTSVYRVKGLVQTDEQWPWTLVNGVAGRFEMRPVTPREPPEQSALVFIGASLDREALQHECQQLLIAEDSTTSR